jgi:hypothetical protein
MLFGAMKAVNMELNDGKSTFENDNPYDKFNLNIPKKDGSSVSVPFLSSVATIPRMVANAGIAAKNLDGGQVGVQAKGLLSQPVRPVVDLLTNTKYNNRPITYQNQTSAEKAKAQAKYTVGQFSHPWVNAVINADSSSGKLETIATATEAPIKFRDARKVTFDGVDTPLTQEQNKKYNKTLKDTQNKLTDQLVGSSEYKQLNGDDQKKALSKLNGTVTDAVKRQIAAEYKLGQYGNEYSGKQTNASALERAVISGNIDPKNFIPKAAGGTTITKQKTSQGKTKTASKPKAKTTKKTTSKGGTKQATVSKELLSKALSIPKIGAIKTPKLAVSSPSAPSFRKARKAIPKMGKTPSKLVVRKSNRA